MDLVALFKALATTKEYKFVYGTRPFLNYEATLQTLSSGEYMVLMFPAETVKVYDHKPVPEFFEYKIIFQLAQAFDSDGTKASLDETYYQKHVRRLKDLETLIGTFEKDFLCTNNLTGVRSRTFPEINLMAPNIDAMNCELTFQGPNI